MKHLSVHHTVMVQYLLSGHKGAASIHSCCQLSASKLITMLFTMPRTEASPPCLTLYRQVQWCFPHSYIDGNCNLMAILDKHLWEITQSLPLNVFLTISGNKSSYSCSYSFVDTLFKKREKTSKITKNKTKMQNLLTDKLKEIELMQHPPPKKKQNKAIRNQHETKR